MPVRPARSVLRGEAHQRNESVKRLSEYYEIQRPSQSTVFCNGPGYPPTLTGPTDQCNVKYLQQHLGTALIVKCDSFALLV